MQYRCRAALTAPCCAAQMARGLLPVLINRPVDRRGAGRNRRRLALTQHRPDRTALSQLRPYQNQIFGLDLERYNA